MNLIIIDPALNTATKIINNIIADHRNIWLKGYSNNLEKGLTLVKKLKPDILYLNLSFSEDSDLYLNEIFALNYPLTLFILNDNTQNINNERLYYSNSINGIIKNFENYLHIITNFEKEFSTPNFYTVFPEHKFMLESDFNYLEFNHSLRGTKYLIDCIFYIISQGNRSLVNNLNQNVYSVLAKYYNTSSQNIKWNIIKSINNMINQNLKDLKKLDYYFDYLKNGKPTAKIIINTFVSRLIS